MLEISKERKQRIRDGLALHLMSLPKSKRRKTLFDIKHSCAININISKAVRG